MPVISSTTRVGSHGVPMQPYGSFAGKTTATDSTPDAFTWTDLTSQSLGAVIESNTITIAGIDTSSAVTFTEVGHLSGEYSLNSGAWTDLAGFNIDNGDTLQLRLTSSALAGETHHIRVDIGGVADTWSVTTAILYPSYQMSDDADERAFADVADHRNGQDGPEDRTI